MALLFECHLLVFLALLIFSLILFVDVILRTTDNKISLDTTLVASYYCTISFLLHELPKLAYEEWDITTFLVISLLIHDEVASIQEGLVREKL
jgi:hypothetical protein